MTKPDGHPGLARPSRPTTAPAANLNGRVPFRDRRIIRRWHEIEKTELRPRSNLRRSRENRSRPRFIRSVDIWTWIDPSAWDIAAGATYRYYSWTVDGISWAPTEGADWQPGTDSDYSDIDIEYDPTSPDAIATFYPDRDGVFSFTFTVTAYYTDGVSTWTGEADTPPAELTAIKTPHDGALNGYVSVQASSPGFSPNPIAAATTQSSSATFQGTVDSGVSAVVADADGPSWTWAVTQVQWAGTIADATAGNWQNVPTADWPPLSVTPGEDGTATVTITGPVAGVWNVTVGVVAEFDDATNTWTGVASASAQVIAVGVDIVWTGQTIKDVSGNTLSSGTIITNDNLYIVVGKLASVQPQFTPSDLDLSSISYSFWEIPGAHITGMNISAPWGSQPAPATVSGETVSGHTGAPYQGPAKPLSISWYFATQEFHVVQDEQDIVYYSLFLPDATHPYGLPSILESNNKIQISTTLWLEAPTVTLTPTLIAPTVDQNDALINPPQYTLHLGGTIGANGAGQAVFKPGININPSQVSESAHIAGPGQFAWLQVFSENNVGWHMGDGTWWGNSPRHDLLDTDLPARGIPSTAQIIVPPGFNDAPLDGCVNTPNPNPGNTTSDKMWSHSRVKTYYMYCPASFGTDTDVIWVPVAEVDWGYGGEATVGTVFGWNGNGLYDTPVVQYSAPPRFLGYLFNANVTSQTLKQNP